jgi:hypothetical protein
MPSTSPVLPAGQLALRFTGKTQVLQKKKMGLSLKAFRHIANPCAWTFWTVLFFVILLIPDGLGAESVVLQKSASPAPASLKLSETICLMDLRPLRALDHRQARNVQRIWDTWHVLTALQGLVNRKQPRLYILYCSEFGVDTDQFWLDWLQKEDGWLGACSTRPLASVEEAVEVFREAFDGLAVYDPEVPATSNAASTAAGCDRLLPIRFDSQTNSLFQILTVKLALPVKLWLVNPDGSSKFTGQGQIPDLNIPSRGSAKADVAHWTRVKYLESGKCDARYVGYYIDAFWMRLAQNGPSDLHTLSNHDYFIAHRGFFFDLSPWKDETPNDDPQQPLGLDHTLFLETMKALYEQAKGKMIKAGGFTPWPFKYTDFPGTGGKHGGVPTEWEHARLLSQYNAYMEADAASLSSLANASFFQHYPLESKYPQRGTRLTREDWMRRGYLDKSGRVVPKCYLAHYVGDYDAPSWLYKAVPAFFRHPKRGQVPLAWAFNPNLEDRAPQALAYAYRHATTNDYFVAGDSGAGYINPRALTIRPESGFSPGLREWMEHCIPYYQRWDLTITGFVLDGAAGASTAREYEIYHHFSPDGLGTHFQPGPALHASIPTCRETDLPDDVNQAIEKVRQFAANPSPKPSFFWARSILKDPGWYWGLTEALKKQESSQAVETVDPYTFFQLIRIHCSNP